MAEILLVHNHYQQKGGEDVVFSSERDLLIRAGHDVVTYERHNDEISNYSALQKIKFSFQTIRGGDSLRELDQLLGSQRPKIVHFHNTFPLISPAAYEVCKNHGAAVIQTLHNFRLFCPAATFFRNNAPCELCLNKSFAWPGVLHACYHNSRVQTSIISSMLAYHRIIRTWQKHVDGYIALSNFPRQKFIEGGLPPKKISVKPNFVYPDPGRGSGDGSYALAIGRLSPEKGFGTLLKAWEFLPSIPLKILGDGPLFSLFQEKIIENRLNNIELLGWQSPETVRALLKGASFLIFPSIWFENFPMTILEAYACGDPVIATQIGALKDIIVQGETGLFFEQRNEKDLAEKVDWAWNHPSEMFKMGTLARREYESRYTAEKNYNLLMDIYEKAHGC
ncbi:MAG: glycosyltransferase family 4 protein [Anaerolineaceae bacterium]|nr:glycosyltransferase family 4 protein [Anaerolineaceae bacterium]